MADVVPLQDVAEQPADTPAVRTPADEYYLTKNRPKDSLASPTAGSATAGSSTAGLMPAKVQDKKDGKDSKGAAKDDKKEKKPSVPIHRLFRFASPMDQLFMYVGLLAAAGHGVLMPMFSIIFGNIIDSFNPNSGSNLLDSINQSSIYFLILAAVAAVTSYIQVSFLMVAGSRQANRIRELYFKAVLRQNMAWYDINNSGEVATRMAGDVLLIQEGISEKVGSGVQFLCMFIAGFVVGFVSGWKMALVILSIVPLMAACGAVMGTLLASHSAKGQAAYAKAGSVAEEVLSSMRTVAAFGGEPREVQRYEVDLELARQQNSRKGWLAGLGIGVTMFIMFCSYGLAFWYGSTLVESGEMTAGDVVTTFFGIIMGSMSLGQAAPSITAMATAAGAAFVIFDTIDRVPEIDSLSDEGQKPARVDGHVHFRNVGFRYPTRPDVPILNGLDLELKPGQTLALVGPSGCGKSTTVALLQRFYDVLSGEVLLDGINVKDLSVRWLRSQIGVVSQEPVLFAKTIAENIAMGRPGASMAEIMDAARQANAHDFITRLPKGYDTLVGQRGTQLSGGQKQRVAIARALIKQPALLLLDEATSALDTKSERVVQEALDRAAKGRSTIIIAHRLSTIQHADQIAVIDKGRVVELGTHAELMAKEDGVYANLVRLQQMRGTIKGASADASDDGEAADVDAIPTEGEHDDRAAPTKPSNKRTESAVTTGSTVSASKAGTTPDDKDAPLITTVDDIKTKGAVSRSYKMNAPEAPAMALGTFAATINGLVFPIFSILFSEVLSDLITKTGEDLRTSVRFWCLIFVALAAAIFLGNLFQHGMFTYSGERLTARLRRLLFFSYLHQEIGWFDDPRRSTGVLSTKLANDVTRIEGITGQRLGMMAQLLATVVGGLVIAFTASWRLALVILATVPFMGLAGFMQMKVMMGSNKKIRKSYEQSGSIASEAVENIRTVISINQEDAFMSDYHASLDGPNKAAMRNAQVGGVGLGFAEASAFLIWALAFFYGARLVEWQLNTFAEIMRATTAIVFGAMMIGQLSSFATDFSKAVTAAAELFTIADRNPPIDSYSNEGKRLKDVRGEVHFHHVNFAYPQRPDVQVLKGLHLHVPVGQTVALVGASGCGKSTVIQLLERFYDPAAGSVTIDGEDIRTLNVTWMRSQIGLVGQEPILFATSIADNIRYGKPDATLEEVEAAARAANAHNFISALPEGYNTFVGEKGTQLSGGQKQRIAIARALVRQPKILLLDEATSALDSESEKVVQEALDRARQGRTSIVIAHRLSTIQDADRIAVFDNGVVVELGTHSELMEARGRYYSLVQNQAVPL